MEIHGRLGTLVSLEQFQTFWLNKLLCLPGGFPLGVVTPLHLIEVANVISSDPGLEINNFYWLLRIDKIGL